MTDDDGAIGSDDMTVTVVAPPPVNQAPTADAGPDRTIQAGARITLNGGGSDPDGAIAAWSWRQVEGPTVALSGANARDVSFTAPDKAATLRLRLTVTDDDGATDTDDVVLTVAAPSEPDTTTGATLQSMLSHINDARAVARDCGGTEYPAQPPLTWSESLAEIAVIHSMDMARQGYFAHTSLDGTTMGERVFPYWSGSRVGENIAASSIDRSDAYVVQLWLDSSGHCALIMDPGFTHAGIGVGRDPENRYDFHHFWTLDFGG
ncbi:MAG: CAP domain-containing protein [Xanthomonadales bacterium]